MSVILQISELELTLKRKQIIYPFSTSIQTGELVCLAGRNGAGKTSLLSCLIGIEHRYTGNISFFGKESRAGILDKVGIMINGISLYSDLTGRENLDIIRRYYDLPSAVISETLGIVGLQDVGKEKVKHYSLGMKQRLSIGIAFIHKPSLVILDEPLNGLDPEAIVEFRQLVKKMNKEFGTTFIIASHSLEEMGKIFTRLLIIKEGKLVLNVDKEELEQYGNIRSELENKRDLSVSSLKQDNLFIKSDEKYIDVTGSNSVLTKLKNQLSDMKWSAFKKVTVEDIYLAANQAEGDVP